MLEIKVSLRIYTHGLGLDGVAAKFDCKEDFGYSEGNSIGCGEKKYYSETMWGKNSSCDVSDSIDMHIIELLDWLEQRKSEYHDLASKVIVKSDICCYLYTDNGQGGAAISSDVIKRLAIFDLDVVIDVYA
jgi:hypothetical protein